jgi:hypothetical protein
VTCPPNRCTVPIMNSSLSRRPSQARWRVSCRSPWPGDRRIPRATRQVRGHHRIVVIRRTGTTRDGMGSRLHPTSTDGRWSARVLSELAGQRGCPHPGTPARCVVHDVVATVHDVSSANQEVIHATPGAARKRRAPRSHSANRGAVPGSAFRESGTVTGPGSRGSPANHLDQTRTAHQPGQQTAKTVSASTADAESG